MRMSTAITTIKDKVGFILDRFGNTRDSDKLLWLAYLVQYHGLKTKLGETNYLILKSIIMNDKTPTMESIRRVRQKYQEAGVYIGKHRHERMVESESVREVLR